MSYIFRSFADILEAGANLLRAMPCDRGKRTEQWLVWRKADTRDFMEIRVAVVGNLDAGKSTLLGVLTYGELDNGRGHARLKLFRHKHEAETGRMSSVGNDILGFDSVGNVPVFVVVTKIDMCPPNVLQETLKLLVKRLKSPGCRTVMVKSEKDVILSTTNFVSERLCPIFQVSNVTGGNLPLLKMFLNLLSTRNPDTKVNSFSVIKLYCFHKTNYLDAEPAEFQIDDTY